MILLKPYYGHQGVSGYEVTLGSFVHHRLRADAYNKGLVFTPLLCHAVKRGSSGPGLAEPRGFVPRAREGCEKTTSASEPCRSLAAAAEPSFRAIVSASLFNIFNDFFGLWIFVTLP